MDQLLLASEKRDRFNVVDTYQLQFSKVNHNFELINHANIDESHVFRYTDMSFRKESAIRCSHMSVIILPPKSGHFDVSGGWGQVGEYESLVNESYTLFWSLPSGRK